MLRNPGKFAAISFAVTTILAPVVRADSPDDSVIASLIRASIANRFLVLMAAAIAAAWGAWAVMRTPVRGSGVVSGT